MFLKDESAPLQAVTAAAAEKLDVQLGASGFKKEHFSALDSYVSALQGMVAPRDGSGSSSGAEESDGSEESDDESDVSDRSEEEAGSEAEGEESGEEEGGETEGVMMEESCSGRSAVAADVSKSGARSEGRGPHQDASASQGAAGQGEACDAGVKYELQLPEDSINGLSIAHGESEPGSQHQTLILPQLRSIKREAGSTMQAGRQSRTL